MATVTSLDTSARLFIGLPVAAQATAPLQEAMKNYPHYIEKYVPPENWHVTLYFLGDVLNHKQYLGRLKQPLAQAYIPAVTITHIGRGLQRGQLWAYAKPTPVLQNLWQEVGGRLRSMRFPLPADKEVRAFVPHIRLASFFDSTRGLGIPDTPVSLTFAVRTAHLYHSKLGPQGARYEIEASIPL